MTPPFYENDLDVFFEDFAEEVVWEGNSIQAIFHNAYEAVQIFGEQFESKDPFLEVKTSDVAGMEKSDIVVARSTTYYVAEPAHDDGTGFSVIRLSLTQGN